MQDPDENPICPLSHPTHPHTLSPSGPNIKFGCFTCGKKAPLRKSDFALNYYCIACDVNFHNGCHKFPRKVTHPYHLQHPLILTFRKYKTGSTSSGGTIYESFRTAVMSHSSTSSESITSESGSIELDKCTCCGKTVQEDCFYRCSICNFCLDISCSQNVPPLVITNPKSHHHSLTFYPRPLLTPCDACGLVNVMEPSYACFQCNYMVHESCIDLPRVIKITRHKHRLFHTPCLQLKMITPCRVCYQTVDTNYGQYSCNRENCSYVVHSKCATHKKVWDGKELEWGPEESDQTEDVFPFKKVGNDLIKHFSHDHLLKLEKYDSVRDAEKQCEACVLPITTSDFYNCVECDFYLHEVCAGLLRVLDHALHKHPLFLDPTIRISINFVDCSSCSRKSSGFKYICRKRSCGYSDAVIDVPCILLPEYFTHQSHEHPLFICTFSQGENKICTCEGCKEICRGSYLQCTKCKFAMCYKCATIPTQVSYKYDKHPLSLCFGEEANDTYWCEICEKEVNPTEWFYTCNECSITIHLDCIFGSSVYIMPGCTLYFASDYVDVLRNSNSTRPYCVECGNRCPGYIYYKKGRGYRYGAEIICSVKCLKKKL